MDQLLLATDYSANSKVAVQYGIEMALKLHAGVRLLHAFSGPQTIGVDGVSIDMTSIESEQSHSDRELKAWTEAFPELDHLAATELITVQGDPANGILQSAEQGKADLVVMGTHGHRKLDDLLFGSTTIDVARHCPCPVLAIPPDAKFKGFRRMLYASDLHDHDIATINKAMDIARRFGSDLILFHAFPEGDNQIQGRLQRFLDKLGDLVKDDRWSTMMVSDNDIPDAIIKGAHEEQADLIIMRERNRGLLTNLFRKNLVKSVNYYTDLPLLTFNDKQVKSD